MGLQAWVRVNGRWRGPQGQIFTPPQEGRTAIAVIGDSHVYQGGNGEGRLRAGLQGAGWVNENIYINGVTGRFIAWTDSTGQTTMSAIADARSELATEPLWLFLLGSNGASESDEVTDGQIDTVLTHCGEGADVLWMNTMARDWPNENRIRRNSRIVAAANRHPELNMHVLDWVSECLTLPAENLWNADGVHHTGHGYDLKNAWTVQQIGDHGYPTTQEVEL